MNPDERTEAEVRADRALRRGELSTALSLYQAISSAFPTDEIVAMKLRRIRENLQPMELTHAKSAVPIEQTAPPTNSIQSAEALAARGDYAGAIALYRKALEKRPDSELIRERLAELFQIAQSMAPRPPVSAPRVARGEPPVSTARLLSDLLDQISRRRRTPHQKG